MNGGGKRFSRDVLAFYAFAIAGLCAIAALVLDIETQGTALRTALNAASAVCFAGLAIVQGIKAYKQPR